MKSGKRPDRYTGVVPAETYDEAVQRLTASVDAAVEMFRRARRPSFDFDEVEYSYDPISSRGKWVGTVWRG